MFHPFSWFSVIAAFVFFRITDILKPFPAGKIQSLGGGLGILLDDCVAGVYANILLVLSLCAMGALGISVF
jgi:phosphatidylglycerophosphatase A